MKRSLIFTMTMVIAVAAGMSLPATAATLSGKVTGVSGASVVYVEAIAEKTFPAPGGEEPVMAQRRLMFQPHILPVQQGTTVEFLNSDSVAHSVFWPSIGGNKKLAHNLGTWPQNERRAFKFDAVGAVPLLCNVHPEMTGYIVVVPTPYFALTSESGEYTIENVPDGTYTVVAWHEGAKPQTKSVSIAGSGRADFAISK